MFTQVPPPDDPKGAVAGANKDYRDDMGVGDDLLHIGGFVMRVVTWPVRVLVRAVRRS